MGRRSIFFLSEGENGGLMFNAGFKNGCGLWHLQVALLLLLLTVLAISHNEGEKHLNELEHGAAVGPYTCGGIRGTFSRTRSIVLTRRRGWAGSVYLCLVACCSPFLFLQSGDLVIVISCGMQGEIPASGVTHSADSSIIIFLVCG